MMTNVRTRIKYTVIIIWNSIHSLHLNVGYKCQERNSSRWIDACERPTWLYTSKLFYFGPCSEVPQLSWYKGSWTERAWHWKMGIERRVRGWCASPARKAGQDGWVADWRQPSPAFEVTFKPADWQMTMDLCLSWLDCSSMSNQWFYSDFFVFRRRNSCSQIVKTSHSATTAS